MNNTSTVQCTKCGKWVIPPGGTTAIPEICECDKKPEGMYGWICPNCGCGLSPFTSSCPHCAPPMRVTWGNPASYNKGWNE